MPREVSIELDGEVAAVAFAVLTTSSFDPRGQLLAG